MDKFNRNLWNLSLSVFLIGSTTYFIAGQEFYAPQEMWFQYGVLFICALSWFVKAERKVTNAYFGAILVYALANTIFMHFQPECRIKLLNFFFGAILIKEVSERVDLNFKHIGNLFALFCAFNVFWIGLQIKHVDPIFTSMFPQNMKEVDVVGFMGLKANLGVLAAVCAPFIYYSNPFNLIICLPLLYFSQSSTAVAAFVITVLFMLWFDNHKLFFIISGLLIPAGLYYILKIDAPTGQFSKRLNVWGAGINYLAGTSPWFGNGLGAWGATKFTTMQENGQPQVWIWAHNEYLQFGFELGICGIVLMYAFFKDMAKQLCLRVSEHRQAVAIMIPVLAVSIFHFPFHLGRFASFMCYSFACAFALLTVKPLMADELIKESANEKDAESFRSVFANHR